MDGGNSRRVSFSPWPLRGPPRVSGGPGMSSTVSGVKWPGRRASLRGRFPETWDSSPSPLALGWLRAQTAHDADPPIPRPCALPAPGPGWKRAWWARGTEMSGGFTDLHGPRESRWCDADDRRGDFIKLDGFADDSGIAAEAVLPVTMRDYHDRLGGGLVVIRWIACQDESFAAACFGRRRGLVMRY